MVGDTRCVRENACRRTSLLEPEQARIMHQWDNSGGFSVDASLKILWPLLRKRLVFKKIYGFALLGYATSGLLDACTSYGTQLL